MHTNIYPEYSKNLEISKTIKLLLSLGSPAISVVPIQKDEKYWKRDKTTGEVERDKDGNPKLIFTGKVPGYLDSNGIPHLIKHKEYQNRLPNESELREWFSNPKNGIGTLGGWHNIVFIDIDVSRFDSQEDCKAKVKEWADNYPQVRNTWIEETHSGGFRVVVKVRQLPDFTNFTFTPGGKHRGEALGKGRFTVLAPTIGPSGNPYKAYRKPIIDVESLESIGIYGTKKKEKEKNNSMPCEPKRHADSNNDNAIPLRLLGNKASQELLEGKINCHDFSKAHSDGVKEWYGWANWADINGIPTTEDVEALAAEAGEALGYDSDKVSRVLDTVEAAKCTPAAYFTGSDIACWKKVHKLNRDIYKAECPESIKKEVQADFDNYNKRRSVEEAVEPDNTSKFSQDNTCRSVEVVEPCFDLSDYLPEEIAEPLKQVAKAMPTSPEMLLTTLLPLCASMIGTSAVVNPWDTWKQPAIIWAMAIAPTGKLKSPTQKVIIKPLWDIETRRHIEEKAKEKKNNKKPTTKQAKGAGKPIIKDTKGDKSSNAINKDLIVKDFTMEALMHIHSTSSRGLLAYRDELDGFFHSMNKYRQGNGDDMQNWLSLHNGEGVKINRKTFEEELRIEKTAVSIVGSIQPKTLEKHLNDANNYSGFNSRWLYCYPQMPRVQYTGIECPDIDEILTQLYLRLESVQNGSVYVFTEEARDLFVQRWYNPIEFRIDQEPNDAIKAVLAKSKGYCTRLALVLHCINGVCKERPFTKDKLILDSEISVETVCKAIALSQYFVEQAEKVYGVKQSAGSSFPTVWERLTEQSIKKGGWIAARYAQQYTKPLIKSADHARKVFKQMAKAGHGKIRGADKSLEWSII